VSKSQAYIISQIKGVSDVMNGTEVADERQLSTYELERLKREETFDKRINELKEQVATKADELHPSVKNLPHNSIDVRNTRPPEIEYAD
jgi:hypothetical protein